MAFHSQVFTITQRNYFASEREMLGIIHALKKYYTILVGGPVINVYTDHKSLCALIFAKAPTTPCLERWRIHLCSYQLKWHYIEGVKHGAADYLSCLPDEIYDKYQCYIKNRDDEVAVEDFDPRNPQYSISLLVPVTLWTAPVSLQLEKRPGLEMYLEVTERSIFEQQQSCD